MRTVFVCLGCAVQYLPPESMTYPETGVEASEVHCSLPACRSSAQESVRVMGVPQEVAAQWARRAAGLDGPVRRPRPGRRARGGRAASAPAAARNRLG
ncbi:hypothetical protein EES37_33590 [Streptomyces sp. ADI91-18]|nr:hypothetical protein EES37_33590 [Streptomyces sp. ADI91-18]